MKRFNVSILAVVAVLAIGLTAFTSADSAKRVTVLNCYTDLVALEDNCSQFTLTDNVTDCEIAQPFAQNGVSSLADANFRSTIECVTTDEVFCCAQLVLVDQPICPTQPRITFKDKTGVTRINAYAKIDAVFCKTQP